MITGIETKKDSQLGLVGSLPQVPKLEFQQRDIVNAAIEHFQNRPLGLKTTTSFWHEIGFRGDGEFKNQALMRCFSDGLFIALPIFGTEIKYTPTPLALRAAGKSLRLLQGRQDTPSQKEINEYAIHRFLRVIADIFLKDGAGVAVSKIGGVLDLTPQESKAVVEQLIQDELLENQEIMGLIPTQKFSEHIKQPDLVSLSTSRYHEKNRTITSTKDLRNFAEEQALQAAIEPLVALISGQEGLTATELFKEISSNHPDLLSQIGTRSKLGRWLDKLVERGKLKKELKKNGAIKTFERFYKP